MILKRNGQVINEPYPVDEHTKKYLERFWDMPTKEGYQTEREKLLTTDGFSH